MRIDEEGITKRRLSRKYADKDGVMKKWRQSHDDHRKAMKKWSETAEKEWRQRNSDK